MIRNILKNGTEVADLTGYIVRESEAPEAYGVIRKRGEGNEKEEQKKQNLEDNHSGGSDSRNDIRLLSRQ